MPTPSKIKNLDQKERLQSTIDQLHLTDATRFALVQTLCQWLKTAPLIRPNKAYAHPERVSWVLNQMLQAAAKNPEKRQYFIDFVRETPLPNVTLRNMIENGGFFIRHQFVAGRSHEPYLEHTLLRFLKDQNENGAILDVPTQVTLLLLTSLHFHIRAKENRLKHTEIFHGASQPPFLMPAPRFVPPPLPPPPSSVRPRHGLTLGLQQIQRRK